MISSEDEARAWVDQLPDVDAAAMNRLERFVAMLADENGRQNLVARSSIAHLWQRHVADSAQLLNFVPRGTTSWLDLGTGAGFPGIIIAALRPELTVTMVESRSRRISWLSRACDELALTKAKVIGKRLELVPDQLFDVISARAFAPLAELLELSARFSTNATQWLLPKGRSAAKELEALTGWQHTFHVEQSVTDPEAGILVGNLTSRKGANS